jgi:phosphonate transport system ATP-binding protein
VLVLEGLTKRYGSQTVAVDDVSLTIEAGELVSLIGPSGAGKSTLIRCINRLVEPTAGKVSLGETELTSLSRARLRRARRRIGMIFQSYALVERLTVMENVLSGQLGYVGFWKSLFRRFPAEAVEDAFELLDRVELGGLHDRRADELSGGQQQRVGIARALLQDPELLLIDEPTASLDPRTARQVMRLLAELCRERNLAAIINIHDVPLARAFTERIVGLNAGAVVFDGHPDELDEAMLETIYGGEDWQTDGDDADQGAPPPAADGTIGADIDPVIGVDAGGDA